MQINLGKQSISTPRNQFCLYNDSTKTSAAWALERITLLEDKIREEDGDSVYAYVYPFPEHDRRSRQGR